MSVIHPGSSINFDEVAMQQNDEDEMYQEELKQRKELQDLLSAELSDELLEDDLSVNNSHQSINYPSPGNNAVVTSQSQQYNGQNGGNPNVANSSIGNQYFEETHEYQQYQPQPNPGFLPQQQPHYYYNTAFTNPQQWQQQQVVYTNSPSSSYQRENGVGQQYLQYDESCSDEHGFPFHERREVEGREDYDVAVDGFSNGQMNGQQHMMTGNDYVEYKQTDSINNRRSFPPSHAASPHHRNNKLFNTSEGSTYHLKHNNNKDERNSFGGTGSNVKDQEYAQLQILHKARGKKVEELTKEIEAMKYDTARDKRMLNHQLAMTKEQMDNVTLELKDCQRKFEHSESVIGDLNAKVNTQNVEIEALQKNKLEMTNKIEVSERTIESLHEQISQLSSSDSLERASSQHDKVVMTMNQRFEQQFHEVNEKLDSCRNQLLEKSEEADDLRDRLKKTLTESEQTLIDKTETINRLTRGLEDAQKQCQTLLGAESFGMKQKYEDALTMKDKLEEENEDLKSKMADAEHHLVLYENALRLGSQLDSKKDHLSQSYNELVGRSSDVRKKLTWDTPKATSSLDSIPQTEIVEKLREELERALVCNKSKRDEVSQIQVQLQQLEEECAHWRKRAGEAQVELGMMSTSQLIGQSESREDLKIALKEGEEKLSSTYDEVKKLEVECAEVKSQMVEMMQEHDNNKREAVARSERACMQLNEDAKAKLRDELTSNHEQRMYEISLEYDDKIQTLNNEISCLKSELMEVKQSYVRVCSEKDNIQNSCEENFIKKIDMEKDDLVNEHKNILQSLEERLRQEKEEALSSLQKKHDEDLQEVKTQLQEQEEEFAQQIETKLAVAKIGWLNEHADSKHKSIESALEVKEKEWNEKFEKLKEEFKEECEKGFEVEKSSMRKMWEEDKVAAMKKEVEQVEAEFRQEKETAVRTANSMHELNMQVLKEKYENKIKQEIAKKANELLAQKSKEDEESKSLYDGRINVLENELKTAKESMMKHEESLLKKDKEIQQKLSSLKASHRGEMQSLVEEQKNMMLEIAMQEKQKNNATAQTMDTFDEEKQAILIQHTKEIQDIQRFYNGRCDDLQLEIEKLLEEREALKREISTNNERMMMKEEVQSHLQQQEEQINKRHLDEVEDRKMEFNKRILELEKERQSVEREKQDLTSQLQQAHDKLSEFEQGTQRSQEASVECERLKCEVEAARKHEEDLTRKQRNDIATLKERMREEYKRWKKEKNNLLEQIKNQSDSSSKSSSSSSVCSRCLATEEHRMRILSSKDDASKKAFEELSDMYAKTLTAIKEEVMTFVSESRGRSRDTISRERKRTADKVRNHYQEIIKKINPSLLEKLSNMDAIGTAQTHPPPRPASSSIDVSFLQDTPRSEEESVLLGNIQTAQDVTNKVEEWRKNSWRSTTNVPDDIFRQPLLSNSENANKSSQINKLPTTMRTAKSTPHFSKNFDEPVKITAHKFTENKENLSRQATDTHNKPQASSYSLNRNFLNVK